MSAALPVTARHLVKRSPSVVVGGKVSPHPLLAQVVAALSRARLGIVTIGLTYILSLTVGAGLVHAGNGFALTQRDALLARARASEPALNALRAGQRLNAALLDGSGNLRAAMIGTVLGLGVVFPYPEVAYRGWVGGIVAVDDAHVSRLSDAREAAYYLLTLLLQLIPYSLAAGVGVNLGLAYMRPRPVYQGAKWIGLPREALKDVRRVYLLVIPLFLVASLWEFFVR